MFFLLLSEDPDYESLWSWSVTDLEGFWNAIWDFFAVRASVPYECVLADARMPGAAWCPGARLNLVDQIFHHATDARPAIVFRNEAGVRGELSWTELRDQVAAVAGSLREFGVVPGDRVVAYLPNVPQTVVALLAVASLGATWSICSPDMGPLAVLERFRQITPKVLIACSGYCYSGKRYDRRDVVAAVRAALPSLTHVVHVPLPDAGDALPNSLDWSQLLSRNEGFAPEQVPFDHPLWIVYSSGTTGIPKAIVHSHGGIVLVMLKDLGLHLDLSSVDRFHWYSSTGWIMWNLQVGALLVGATICLYDGNPGWPDLNALWHLVAAEQITFFGAGAAFYANCAKAGIEPGQTSTMPSLRALGSTGSPLPPEAYRWVYEKVDAVVWLTSIAGGTDLAGLFLGGSPTLPVYAGEMQCRVLGAKVEAWNELDTPVLDTVGELICAAPIPSMPLYFWNDVDNTRYLDSYFNVFPGVWRHGDWIRLVPRDGAVGAVIYGRSDATINRHGIRMGTAELYRVVESLPEVMDSLVVDLEYLGHESYMPLFVVLRTGVTLDDALRGRINAEIRCALSARHVPSEILAVAEVPRTLSGKKMELPIKKLLLGGAVEQVAHSDSLANATSLDWFVEFARARQSRLGRSAQLHSLG